MEIAVPDSERPTFAVVAEDRAIPGILTGMGCKGAQCVSNPHRTVKGAAIIWLPILCGNERGGIPRGGNE